MMSRGYYEENGSRGIPAGRIVVKLLTGLRTRQTAGIANSLLGRLIGFRRTLPGDMHVTPLTEHEICQLLSSCHHVTAGRKISDM